MAKKRNQDLRPERDQLKRKKPNDSTAWARRMLEGVLTEERTSTKRKATTNKAKRLTGDSL